MVTNAKYDLESIGRVFGLAGSFVGGEPYGSGHINDTFRVGYDHGGSTISYVFQRLNHEVFKDPANLMRNVDQVYRHLGQIRETESGISLRPLEFYTSTRDGSALHLDPATGTYWRVCDFVENTRTYDVITGVDQAFRAAHAFGQFQRALLDLPCDHLTETIKGFHDGRRRFVDFEAVLGEDVCGRVASATAEIDFVLDRREVFSRLSDLHAAGALPERITHNDCKLNNVLFDQTTGEAVCVIDPDTVMPGFVAYDFGDLVRTATSSTAEDETDLSLINMEMPLFQALARGYVEATQGFLTEVERDLLGFSGKLMTLTIGLRFLGDHLAGDVYFGAHHEGHNLDRCRAQFKLVESIEAQEDEMNAFVASL